jgi:hypothetical protein
LIDPKEDKLLGSFEAPTRLEAVRAARDAWTGVQAVAPSANATTPAPSLKIDTAEADRVTRNGIHLIWNRPAEGDSSSGWLLEAYSDTGQLLDIAVADDPTDALLTIIENLLPPVDPGEPD